MWHFLSFQEVPHQIKIQLPLVYWIKSLGPNVEVEEKWATLFNYHLE